MSLVLIIYKPISTTDLYNTQEVKHNYGYSIRKMSFKRLVKSAGSPPDKVICPHIYFYIESSSLSWWSISLNNCDWVKVKCYNLKCEEKVRKYLKILITKDKFNITLRYETSHFYLKAAKFLLSQSFPFYLQYLITKLF